MREDERDYNGTRAAELWRWLVLFLLSPNFIIAFRTDMLFLYYRVIIHPKLQTVIDKGGSDVRLVYGNGHSHCGDYSCRRHPVYCLTIHSNLDNQTICITENDRRARGRNKKED